MLVSGAQRQNSASGETLTGDGTRTSRPPPTCRWEPVPRERREVLGAALQGGHGVGFSLQPGDQAAQTCRSEGTRRLLAEAPSACERAASGASSLQVGRGVISVFASLWPRGDLATQRARERRGVCPATPSVLRASAQPRQLSRPWTLGGLFKVHFHPFPIGSALLETEAPQEARSEPL